MKKMRLGLILLISGIILFGLACKTSVSEIEKEIPYVDTGVDSESWVLIPAGEFYRGQFNEITKVPYDYEIMLTPVTNAQYAEYLNEALAKGSIKVENGKVLGYYAGDKFYGYRHERRIEAGYWLHLPLNVPGVRIKLVDGKFVVKKGFENHPVTMVTWFGAKAYCEFYGWRLPSEVEWEKAARGTDKRAYPWGDEIDKSYANYLSSNKEIRKIFGVSYGITTPVGFFNGKNYNGFQTKDARSPYGVYDMAGNVWEWTGDDYPYMHDRFLRGGSWRNYGYDLRVWVRNNAGPDFYAANIGFRCVREVEKKAESTEENR